MESMQPGQTQPLQASASGREAEAFPLISYLPILCHPPDTECMAVSSSIRSQPDVEEEAETPQPHARVLPGRTLQQSLACICRLTIGDKTRLFSV